MTRRKKIRCSKEEMKRYNRWRRIGARVKGEIL